MPKPVTQTDFAKMVGVNKSTITRLKNKGKLDGAFVEHKGKEMIDVGKAIALLHQNMDPRWVAQGKLANIELPGSPPAPKQSAGADITKKWTLNEVTIAQRLVVTNIKQLELQEKKGELVARADVEKQAFDCARAVRDAILNVPARIGANLAAETEQLKVEKMLTDELTLALEELTGRYE